MSNTYNADAIEVLTGLDPVRKRPGMYTDTTRPNHLVQEVIDNSVDEALAGFARTVTLTLNKDGSVPSDNPFIDIPNALPEIFSYGHRNMQGLVVMEDGRIFEHEHGPRGGDEFNLIEPGKNYGWPAITYGIDYSGYDDHRSYFAASSINHAQSSKSFT